MNVSSPFLETGNDPSGTSHQEWNDCGTECSVGSSYTYSSLLGTSTWRERVFPSTQRPQRFLSIAQLRLRRMEKQISARRVWGSFGHQVGQKEDLLDP